MFKNSAYLPKINLKLPQNDLILTKNDLNWTESLYSHLQHTYVAEFWFLCSYLLQYMRFIIKHSGLGGHKYVQNKENSYIFEVNIVKIGIRVFFSQLTSANFFDH